MQMFSATVTGDYPLVIWQVEKPAVTNITFGALWCAVVGINHFVDLMSFAIRANRSHLVAKAKSLKAGTMCWKNISNIA